MEENNNGTDSQPQPKDQVEQRDPQRDFKERQEPEHYDRRYERYRRDGPEQLQPQVQSTGKHWYDEYPVVDRRKQIEESIKERKTRQDFEEQERKERSYVPQNYDNYQPEANYPEFNKNSARGDSQGANPDQYALYKKYENGGRDGYSYPNYEPQFRNEQFSKSHNEFNPSSFNKNKYDFISKSPKYDAKEGLNSSFDNAGFDDLIAQKNQSKSYNRNMGIHKRAFAQPKSSEFSGMEPAEPHQYGRSASHGFTRHFQAPSFKSQFPRSQDYRAAELKFNKKSVNYDMSEIELPAYCKTHPDGKLLYIITPEGMESELGCAHCALDVEKNSRCSVIEVKQKLEEYISQADHLLTTAPSQPRGQIDPNLAAQVSAHRDKEIALIRQYYDQVMSALAQERDRHIAEISNICEQNLNQSAQGHKKPKIDIKLNNFCVELGKVVEGVDETGIHIKELWKINQDYKDVVRQKLEGGSSSSHSVKNLMSFEFQPAEGDILKDLAKRIGRVVTQSVTPDYFISQPSYNYPQSNSRNYGERSQGPVENVPTFGMSAHEEPRKYSDKKYGYPEYKPSYNEYKSTSPVRQEGLNYNHPPHSAPNQQQENRPSGKYEHFEKYENYNSNKYEGKYDQVKYDHYSGPKYDGYKDSKESSERKYEPIAPYQRPSSQYNGYEGHDGNYSKAAYKPGAGYENYRKGIYDERDVRSDNRYNDSRHGDAVQDLSSKLDSAQAQLSEEDHRSIEEIKKKYAKDSTHVHKVSDLYDDYKKQVEPKDEKKETPPAKNGDLKESKNEQKEEKHEGREVPAKKVIKKLKTKSKGEKENVLKTIKLKLK